MYIYFFIKIKLTLIWNIKLKVQPNLDKFLNIKLYICKYIFFSENNFLKFIYFAFFYKQINHIWNFQHQFLITLLIILNFSLYSTHYLFDYIIKSLKSFLFLFTVYIQQALVSFLKYLLKTPLSPCKLESNLKLINHIFYKFSDFYFNCLFGIRVIVIHHLHRLIGIRVVALWWPAWRRDKCWLGFWAKKIQNLNIVKIYKFCKSWLWKFL